MVRLIMLCQAVSAKVSAGCVCLCVGVRRLCRRMEGELAHYLAII